MMATEFIVGSEDRIIHTLKKENPHKIFYSVGTICEGMKRINLDKVIFSLERMKHRVNVPEDMKSKSRIAFIEMLKANKRSEKPWLRGICI